MSAPLRISNRQARHLWLWSNLLSATPTGAFDLQDIIWRLGFVQIDTIRNVTRAHNHILWTRNQNIREGMIWDRLRARGIFEHFTHDASLIDMRVLPYWRQQFDRLGARVARSDWYKSGLARDQISAIRNRIAAEGALSTHAFDTKVDKREMWARPPHKKALDQMWYAGELATCHRKNFVKFYDLGERVFPAHDPAPAGDATDWLCTQALDRLSFGTSGEIGRFWDVLNARETKAWCDGAALVKVEVETAQGDSYAALAPADIETRLNTLPHPTTRLRILNPFDPAIRDRARLEKLFGFDYRNEMFVPKDKRRWGYYVYPLLEGDRFVGRIELKADRKAGLLSVIGFWPEPGVRWGAARHDKLQAELVRFGRFAGLSATEWQVGRA
ncbi:winged helix-turn-helix domain-containing protein [Aliiroseovarius marinus]|uniref:winged helix-turn-helix domain-containing protein n=1 Tax=Aliiroseovarius marinus TaxID=2500159 RepID=UPI003D7E66BA